MQKNLQNDKHKKMRQDIQIGKSLKRYGKNLPNDKDIILNIPLMIYRI
jgi:hypothetical protein